MVHVHLVAVFTAITMLTAPVSNAVKAVLPMTTADYAVACGMTEDEFVLLSSICQAEGNRSNDPYDSGMVLIAETILNRVRSPQFPNSISEVISQPNQFSTYVGGCSIVDRTETSDMAVRIAVQEIEQGIAPNVVYFNCISYSYGQPYCNVGGNFFSTEEL